MFTQFTHGHYIVIVASALHSPDLCVFALLLRRSSAPTPPPRPVQRVMTAHAQAFANYSAAINHSESVQFFRATPRWPSAPSEFDFSLDYLTPVALTALIPIFFAVVLVIALIVHIAIRFTCRHRHTNDRLRRLHQSKKATLILIPMSAALLMFIFVFTSLGLLGNAMLNQSANDALNVFEALVNDLSRSGFAVVDTAIYLNEQLKAFKPNASNTNSSILSATVGDMVTPTYIATKSFVLERYPDVSELRNALNSLREKIIYVFTVVRRIVGIVYSVMLAVILLLVSAPPLLRIATARGIPRICSLFAYLLYLMVPTLLAWALVGIMSAVGATVSDVCASLSSYRDTLRGVGAANSNRNRNNAFVASGFTCPEGISAASLQQQIEDTATSILQSDLARTTVERILSVPAEQIAEAATWTSQQVPRYLNCSAQIEFSGQLEFLVCGKDGRSSIDGVWNLWVAFIGLALCLSGAMFASLMGMHVMRAFDVWSDGVVEIGGGGGVDDVDEDFTLLDVEGRTPRKEEVAKQVQTGVQTDAGTDAEIDVIVDGASGKA